MPESYVLDAAELGFVPRDRPYWTSPDMLKTYEGTTRLRPLYSIGQVAQVFFGRSTVWLKLILWQREDTAGVLEEVAPARTAAGRLSWRLYDIEILAHVLLGRGAITLQHWILVLGVVKFVAVMNRFDVGDPRIMQPLDDHTPISRQRALALVHQRLTDQDEDKRPADVDAAEEHLIERAAWAIRHLEHHLEGKPVT